MQMIDGKSILVTGGTGYFGQRFIRFILRHYSPKKVIIYSRDEHKQFLMREELIKYDNILRFFIGNIRDEDRLRRAMKGVDYVIHAAALKQVTSCEYNPIEAIKTNVFGAINVLNASIDAGVEKVVALSTDKSVNPVNMYGGTKLVSDKLFIYGNSYSGEDGPCFSIVRFGNIADSRGAVIPYFLKLIKQGKKELPITDYRMTRFWCNINQGIGLVIKALTCSHGGEIFVAKSPSFKITELAKALLPDCQMRESGIREGEKIHETMISREDANRTYEYHDCYVVYPNGEWWKKEMILDGGIKVEEDFEYISATNEEWIGIEEIREQIGNSSMKEGIE